VSELNWPLPIETAGPGGDVDNGESPPAPRHLLPWFLVGVLVLGAGIAAAASTGALSKRLQLASPGECGGSGPCYAQGSRSWDRYYADPLTNSTWAAFCAGSGAGALITSTLDVPACGPTGSVSIALPGGDVWSGWGCQELAQRFLYVNLGWDPTYETGARFVDDYAKAHGLEPVLNGTGRAPEVGDVISYSHSPTWGGGGHVAIVSNVQVDASGNGAVQTLNENAQADGSDIYGAALVWESVTRWRLAPIYTGDGFSPYIEWLPTGSLLAGPAGTPS
jgi:hypothetical protein